MYFQVRFIFHLIKFIDFPIRLILNLILIFYHLIISFHLRILIDVFKFIILITIFNFYKFLIINLY